jgi:hypothetical protein
LTNQKQELIKAAMLGNASGLYEQAKWFQRRNSKTMINQKKDLPIAAMFFNGLGRNEKGF